MAERFSGREVYRTTCLGCELIKVKGIEDGPRAVNKSQKIEHPGNSEEL